MNIVYVGNFSQPHCTEVHVSATLEDLGHKVTRLQENELTTNWVKSKGVSWGEIDLFLYTRTWGKYVTLDDLQQLKELGVITASYHLDLYVGLQREDGLKDDPFWKTDFVFTPDGSDDARHVFEKYNINHYYIKPGVYKKECINLPKVINTELGNDVIFVGGGSSYMHKEWPYRKHLVDWLSKTYKYKYSKYGHPEKTVRNMELNQLYANSKVVVGDSLCLDFKRPYYWSDRVYETLGRGGFIIHPFIEGMQEEFTDGENIVFYEYTNFKQLKEKIDFYLNNEEERERIRKNGFELVSTKATYHERLTQALDIVTSQGSPKTLKKESNNGSHPIKINLGAGTDLFEGYVNVDFLKLPGIDVVHNLLHFPYPFKDNSATNISAVDVVEHLPNFTKEDEPMIIKFIDECYRILQPGGELYIQTPGYRAEFLWQDPTHVRGFHIKTFDLFDPSTEFGQTTGFYSQSKFSVKAEELPNHNLRFWMRKI